MYIRGLIPRSSTELAKAVPIGFGVAVLKDIEICTIIVVPLIMALSRGHTGQIKRTAIMR